MAIFSKPPAKKTEPARAEPKVRQAGGAVRPAGNGVRPASSGVHAVSARELLSEVSARDGASRPVSSAPADASTTTQARVPDSVPVKPAIEIEQASNGLCPAVENAALMFASDQMRAARELLQDGVVQDAETKASALAWLCLFDLLRRMGDKSAFDRMALQYLVQFERSAPGWEELGAPSDNKRAAGSGGALTLTGKLTAATALQLEPLKRIAGSDNTQFRLDLGGVGEFDDEGARLLADSLAGVRRRRAPLAVLRPEKLRDNLDIAVNEGRAAGQGVWLLLLELLQWTGQQAAFDDRAVEYAVTFEMSPPSWEPLPPPRPSMPAPRKPKPRGGDAEVVAWTDPVTGATPREVKELLEFAEARSNVVLDMSALERMDFASAGALSNAIHRLGAQKKTLQIAGATPILRALLLLVGVAPDIFIRKPT